HSLGLENGDGLDLDELSRIAEKGDAEERARRAAQQAAHRVPRANEVSPLVADHEDRRLQERGGGRTGFCERSEKIVCGVYGLSFDVARRDHVALWIERTSTGSEDEPSADPAV